MAGGSAVEQLLAQLRERLPWLLRGSALVSAGAIVGLGLGVAVGMPGMIGGERPEKPRRAATARTPKPAKPTKPDTQLQARAPSGAPDPAPVTLPGGAGPSASELAPGPAPLAAPRAGTQVIQVAATPFRPLADAVRKRLADVGYKAYVDTVVLEGRQRFRVRVDPEPGRETATVASELKALGYPVWVTQE